MDIIHLFYIHSNITYISSIAVIEKERISNPILIFGRNFRNDYFINTYEKIFLPKEICSLNLIPSYGKRWLLLTHGNYIKKFKKILDTFKSGYKCYLPHTKDFMMQMVVMNRNCIEYNIIEEGLLSYTSSEIIKDKKIQFNHLLINSIKRKFNYINHLNLSMLYCDSAAIQGSLYLFYHTKIINNSINIKEIHWPNIKTKLPEYSGKEIFLLDNLCDKSIKNLNYYLIYKKIFSFFSGKELWLKFHPATGNDNNILFLLSELGIKVNIINRDVPLELVFLKSEKIKIYGIFSSLLFYAGINGHEAISYLKTAQTVDENIKLLADKIMPSLFFEKVTIL